MCMAGLRLANCIKFLDLSNNKITMRGAKKLADQLFKVGLRRGLRCLYASHML